MGMRWKKDYSSGHLDWELTDRKDHHGMVCTLRDRIGCGSGMVVAVFDGHRLGWFHTVVGAKEAVKKSFQDEKRKKRRKRTPPWE